MPLKIDVFACLKDNYGFLVADEGSGKVALIDAPEPARIMARMAELGLDRLDYILNTHWHPDHAGGNALLKKRFGCVIYGPSEVRKIAPLDHELVPGDVFYLGETRLDIIDLKGHTLGLIGYVDRQGGNAFIGDGLFPLGCGRLFEGTREEMWASMLRLCELPDQTRLYSAHEYTLSNLKFAEHLGVNSDLAARADKIRAMRERGDFTVPSTMGEEKATNPFIVYPLRENGFAAQAAKFGELRKAKDLF